jgi:tetratricopeptide (TPR) repeat protein
MLDGTATLTNAWGATNLSSGELGIAVDGSPPIRMRLEAKNIVQWWLYYPAVLDIDEVNFSAIEKEAWGTSLQAYREGDLSTALTALPGYPDLSRADTDPKRIYLATLLLAAGQVDKAKSLLGGLSQDSSLATALTRLIGAVQNQVDQEPSIPVSGSEWLGVSYYYQARHEPRRLEKALWAATNAVAKSPNFSFGWERVAELEFGFGHTARAKAALEKSLSSAPRNAQAHALRGFVLSAENRLTEARKSFEEAIQLDPSLGNAWLGRGLVRIRKGDLQGGREDLQTAVILEPNRSLLRSYLGKAFAEIGATQKAESELKRAVELDPHDPTPWLYSALLKQEENRVNEAITDMQTSQELNDNRSLFRSGMLLDEDRAVRSANLASIYSDAGLTDFSVREAGKAVTSDYANYSAHLFLANSYNALRDPNLINLRYETATFSEYLLANLLSPVGGSRLSPYVSQQEYSKLFEQEGLGFSSETTYLSDGDWLQQASQYGWFNDTGYALDAYYLSRNGQRPNNDIEQKAASVEVKQQLTQQDSVYLQAIFSKVQSGDERQLYDPSMADLNLRVTDEQLPNLFMGYHHEWSPGMHTLFLGGRLEDRFSLSDANEFIRGVIRNRSGDVVNTVEEFLRTFGVQNPAAADTFEKVQLHSEFEAYSAELQQIAELRKQTLIAGVRYQTGETDTKAQETRSVMNFPPYNNGQTDFVATQQNTTDLKRLSIYGYDQWHPWDPFWLTAGLTYDHLDYPLNINLPPVSAEQQSKDQVSPKAGFLWQATPLTAVRGAYTRSLGGLFYDSSVRLEPVQIAGFNQAYRSLIPESVEGAISGSEFETYDLGFEQRLKSRTYFVMQLELLRSKATQGVGVFDADLSGVNDAKPSQLQQKIEYEEQSLTLSVNQLLGRFWSLGANYRLSQADLKTYYPEVPEPLIPATHNRAVMHALNLFAIFNHPSGFFAEAQALWHGQDNFHYEPALVGADFWQFNLLAGYRFPRRQAEITLGLLNLADQDYHLNPLNLYAELPHGRTLQVSLRFNF